MESERQALPVLSADSLIIDLHIIVDSFFIAEMIVVLHLGIHDAAMRCVVLFLLILILVTPLAFLQELLFGSTIISLRVLFFHHKLRASIPVSCK